ncbi:MAG TPA: HEAT repeat domain-containing protein [Blastocatellia bacterium]|nr:HEAT repeat domain-containing protein [Blastocatellia bacterium]
MRRIQRLAIALSVLALFIQRGGISVSATVHLPQQTIAVDPIYELLQLPAPPPNWRESSLKEASTEKGSYDLQRNPPGDDAPLEVLIGYWSSHSSERGGGKPSPSVSKRLLEGAEKNPATLISLLDLLPAGADTHDRVKKLLDQEELSPQLGADWNKRAREWLMTHSAYFRDELERAAKEAKDEDGWVRGKEIIEALVKLDWPRAEPLLKKLASGAQPRTAALALSLLYKYAVKSNDAQQEEALRTRLKSIVADKQAKGYARDTAGEALLTSEWNGRDEWYLSLFSDETLRNLFDGNTLFSPLTTPVAISPDKWIPVITKLVGDKNRAIHDAAVSCLIIFQLKAARSDALRPLLPWLFDPKWSSARDRLRLIQSLEDLNMPESVPGLIQVVERDDDEYDRSYAAESLAAYRDPRAIPALKKALAKEKVEHHRRRIITAIIVCGGLTDAEAISALETYAAQVATSQGRRQFENYLYDLGGASIPAEISIGYFLSRSVPPSEELAAKALAHARNLEVSRPTVAGALLDITHSWSGKTADLDIIKRIAESRADAKSILSALQRRETMRQTAGQELRDLVKISGAPRGVALALLGDQEGERETLEGSDKEAQRALLACARLAREPLPVAIVGKLLKDDDRKLAMAAESYLESEDGAEARKLVLAQHPAEALILGARQEFDPGHHSFAQFDHLENQLRDELRKPDGDDEIFALLSAGYWGDAGQIVIRIRQGKAELIIYKERSRFQRRALGADELQALKAFIAENRVDDLAPLNTMVHDGIQYEYAHLTRDGGRRVFMNNPGSADTGGSVYELLVQRFHEIVKREKLEVRYRIGERVRELEILLADDNKRIKAVWKSGDDLRALVEDEREGDFAWQSFNNGKLGAGAPQPEGFFILGSRDDMPERMEADEHHNRAPWQVRSGKDIIRAGIWQDQQGLWRCRKGKDPIKIVSGYYGAPVVTPDGRWAVVAKTDTDWSKPNFVYRVDLTSGKEFKVGVPAADVFNPVAFIASHSRVLLLRTKDDNVGPDRPEYRLLDPATGASQVVSGRFEPVEQQTYRPLQPSGARDEVWAAIYNEQKEVTEVGRYNRKSFTFTPRVSFPEINFNSMEMWIDESEGRIYVAYNNHLLRLPLQR